MAGASSLLFEGPPYLAFLTGVGFALLMVGWFRAGDRRLAVAACALAVATGGLLLAQLVETDRERIDAVLADIARDLERGRTDAVRRHLDEDYIGFEYMGSAVDKAGAVRLAERVIRTRGVKSIRATAVRVTVEGDSATSRFGTIIEFADGGGRAGRVPLRWQMEWIRRDGAWKIYRAARPEYGLAGPGRR
jgi:ketosteroid isomerase-like protein